MIWTDLVLVLEFGWSGRGSDIRFGRLGIISGMHQVMSENEEECLCNLLPSLLHHGSVFHHVQCADFPSQSSVLSPKLTANVQGQIVYSF